MFQCRLRTLVDELLLTDVPEETIAAMVRELGRDAELDRAKWGQFGQAQRISRAVEILEEWYAGYCAGTPVRKTDEKTKVCCCYHGFQFVCLP